MEKTEWIICPICRQKTRTKMGDMLMRVHQQSTRIRIVGGRNGGSALESASYISRTTLTSEKTGETYYPKYHEDLVFSDIFLPENAPAEYKDRFVLWNSVEQAERSKNAQLARTIKADLPNDWSYNLAKEVVADFVKKTFADKGMCADVAIHDSVNEKGQRNLHCHIMLTMRPILENGEWGAKSKKEYILDKDGNKIKTKSGSYKSRKVDLVDWNSRDKAKEWRTALADEINRVNREQNIAVRWEHRSFKEQGIEREPMIHLGAVASALERQGVKTERGNINREIIKRNAAVWIAQKNVDVAKREVEIIKSAVANIMDSAREIKSEVKELIGRMAEKFGRLSLPIAGGECLSHVTDRTSVQSIENAMNVIEENGLYTFDDVRKFYDDGKPLFKQTVKEYKVKAKRFSDLKNLIQMYEDNLPYKAINDQSRALTGIAKWKYDKKHSAELSEYVERRTAILDLLPDDEKKITPKKWEKERDEIAEWAKSVLPDMSKSGHDLATCEAIQYSKKDLQRILDNEERAKNRQLQKSQSKKKHREESL